MEKQEVPIWEKANLTIDEAAAYFGIGTNKLREITSNPDCEFVIRVGAKRLIKRKNSRDTWKTWIQCNQFWMEAGDAADAVSRLCNREITENLLKTWDVHIIIYVCGHSLGRRILCPTKDAIPKGVS